MQTFYKKLCKSSQSSVPYLRALFDITKATQTQIHAIASELSWQSWSETEKRAQA